MCPPKPKNVVKIYKTFQNTSVAQPFRQVGLTHAPPLGAGGSNPTYAPLDPLSLPRPPLPSLPGVTPGSNSMAKIVFLKKLCTFPQASYDQGVAVEGGESGTGVHTMVPMHFFFLDAPMEDPRYHEVFQVLNSPSPQYLPTCCRVRVHSLGFTAE